MPIGIKLAKKGLGLLGKKLKKKKPAGGTYGTVEGAKDYVPYLSRKSEAAADAALKRKNIERIRKLPESIGGKGIKKFGSGAEEVTRDKKLMKKIFPKGKK